MGNANDQDINTMQLANITYRFSDGFIELDDDADVNAQDWMGFTALHHVVAYESQSKIGIADSDKKRRIINHLLSMGADPTIEDRVGRIPLWHAVLHDNDVSLLEALMTQGATLDTMGNGALSIYEWCVVRKIKSDRVLMSLVLNTWSIETQYLMDQGLLDQCVKCKTRKDDMSHCTGCFLVQYCGKSCQSDDWSNHKVECHATRQKFILQLQAPGGICRCGSKIVFSKIFPALAQITNISYTKIQEVRSQLELFGSSNCNFEYDARTYLIVILRRRCCGYVEKWRLPVLMCSEFKEMAIIKYSKEMANQIIMRGSCLHGTFIAKHGGNGLISVNPTNLVPLYRRFRDIFR